MEKEIYAYAYNWDNGSMHLSFITLTKEEYEAGHHYPYNQFVFSEAELNEVIEEAKAAGLTVS